MWWCNIPERANNLNKAKLSFREMRSWCRFQSEQWTQSCQTLLKLLPASPSWDGAAATCLLGGGVCARSSPTGGEGGGVCFRSGLGETGSSSSSNIWLFLQEEGLDKSKVSWAKPDLANHPGFSPPAGWLQYKSKTPPPPMLADRTKLKTPSTHWINFPK